MALSACLSIVPDDADPACLITLAALCFLELKKFVRCTTGGLHCRGNAINVVVFTAEPDADAFVFSTCANQLAISERIESQEFFSLGLMAVIQGKDFTMT